MTLLITTGVIFAITTLAAAWVLARGTIDGGEE